MKTLFWANLYPPEQGSFLERFLTTPQPWFWKSRTPMNVKSC